MTSCIFGPVPSRRLGRSLGIDLVPYKTCTYDCVYCQLGRTTVHSSVRNEWVPLDKILGELEENLSSTPDYITFSGSGEPTLYSRLGELIKGIHEITDIPVAVLTNSSLLWMPEVRADLAEADLVVPSLDAGTPEVFKAVNRPCPGISFEKVTEGLIEFASGYTGRLHLEILIVKGMNDNDSEIKVIAGLAKKIDPDCIEINTVTRPPAEDSAVAAGRERLEQIASMFDPPAEIIAPFKPGSSQPEFSATRLEVLSMLQRRPCSLDDVAAGLGIHRNDAVKYIEMLAAEGEIVEEKVSGETYYKVMETD